MRYIYKYDVPWPYQEEFELWLPGRGVFKGPEFLTLQEQDGRAKIWVEVDKDQADFPYRFVIVGTGNSIPEPPSGQKPIYIGTWQEHGFVWHLYYFPPVMT